MTAYLVLWDRDPNAWADASKEHLANVKGRRVEGNWSCGTRKTIPVGSRIFLKRTGAELRGILASAYSRGPVFPDDHWRLADRKANYVPVVFDSILNPFADEVLPQSKLVGRTLGKVHWNTQGGGLEIPTEAEQDLESLWADHLRELRHPSVSVLDTNAPLQKRGLVWARRRERSSAFSRMVRLHSNGVCAACPKGVSWLTENVLEAAHIRPVEEQGPDMLSNAMGLCPNHHALFDAGLWTVDPGRRIRASTRLGATHRKTLAPKLNITWDLDSAFLAFHRNELFGE